MKILADSVGRVEHEFSRAQLADPRRTRRVQNVAASLMRAPSAPLPKAHPPRKSRLARLEFAATNVVIPRPHRVAKTFPDELELNLVHVRLDRGMRTLHDYERAWLAAIARGADL